MKGEYNISSIASQDLCNPVDVFEDLIAHHSPFAVYLFNWVDFQDAQQCRVLMSHDIELKDGTVVHDCFPVTNGWLQLQGTPDTTFANSDVKRIRLTKQQPLMNKPWSYRGEDGPLDKPDYV